MENFVLPEGTDTLKESREMLNNALLTVRSLSCGTAFPVNNLTEGMLCYRTDQGKIYQYTASGTWSDVIALQANSAMYDSAGNKLEANIYVNLSGSQNITGTKTFKTSPIVENPVLAPITSGLMWFNGAISRVVGSITAANYTGNANTATALQNARNINGRPFDGTSDVTIDIGVKSVNGQTPDDKGDVDIVAVSEVSKSEDGNLTFTFTDDTTQNVEVAFTKGATTVGSATENTPAVVVETYRLGASWYRKYSDGWIEQGGRLPPSTGEGDQMTVTLPTSFVTTQYTLAMTPDATPGSSKDNGTTMIVSKATTNFVYANLDYQASGTAGDWYACGL